MKLRGFTIVELLIVIVVIAIIAAISIVAYSGTTQKATVSSIQADLTNAKKQLLAFQASSTTNSFPTAINCTNPSATEICLRPTGSNTFSYTPYTGSSPAFYLTSTNGTNTYTITESTSPLDKSSIITNGLVLNLDAGNTASYPGSGTTWFDLSGKGNNATLFGGISYSSNNGGSLVFDGITSYASGSINTFANGAAYTSITWVKLNNTSNEQHLTNLRGSIGLSVQFYVASSKTGSWNYGDISGGSVIANNWYMLVQTKDTPGNGVHYVNGVRVGSGTLPSYGNSSTYFIGDYLGYNVKVAGNISISQIYNRALSQSEISQNFNALRGRYGI